ncbi:MAG: cupin domain-containing protein [Ginsengibacter sp.]
MPFPPMQKISLPQKFSLFSDHWNPRIIGELNGQHVKLAKLKGEFTWHAHDREDELFLVVKGQLKIKFRDQVIVLDENEMLIVPRGVEHCPVADKEVWVLLFEPISTVNTGNSTGDYTRNILDKL